MGNLALSHHPLVARALIKVEGNDAHAFLQNQLANDINRVEVGKVLISAYCQHQGRMIALLWVMPAPGGYWMSLPEDLAEALINHLKRFVLLLSVKIYKAEAPLRQVGLIGAAKKGVNVFALTGSLSIMIDDTQQGIVTTQASLQESDRTWEKALIDERIPEVSLATSEKIIPQMAELDQDERGVSFSKGCYPGQEVIARLHYLGKTKRAMVRCYSKIALKVGDALYVNDREVGLVMRAITSEQGTLALAVLDTRADTNQVNLVDKKGPQAEWIKP